MNYHMCIILIGLASVTVLPSIYGQGPRNTAATVGTPRTIMDCADPTVPSNQYMWHFANTTERVTRQIVSGCKSLDPQLYDVDSSTPNSCNLIILNAQLSQAGRYMCFVGSPVKTSLGAEFNVFETEATCSFTGDPLNGYKFLCSVYYLGYLSPVVTWYNGSAENGAIAGSYYLNGSYASASFDVPGGVYDLPPNLCVISVRGYGSTSGGIDSSAPSYTSYCRVYGVPTLSPTTTITTTAATSPTLTTPATATSSTPISPTAATSPTPPTTAETSPSPPQPTAAISPTATTTNSTATATTSTSRSPEYMNLSRNVGILAGRTRVIITITSQGNVNDVRNVYFGDTPQMAINSVKTINVSCKILDVYTPPARAVGNVSIIIENTDGYNWIDPTAYFEYRDNPTIAKLLPTNHLTSGGTRVTIEGSNLDAAEASSLQLTVTVYRTNKSAEQLQTYSADCFGIIEDTYPTDNRNKSLLCRMPKLNLPDDFMIILEEKYTASRNSSYYRRKRSLNSNLEVARFQNKEEDFAVAVLNIVTDGYQPDLVPTVSFNVTFIPSPLVTFDKYKEVVRIRSGNPDNIEMKGRYINTIESDNFVITVGSDNCTIQSKQDNLILYRPPRDKPSRKSVNNDTYCNDDLLDIRVSINQEQHNDTQWVCGCAEYYNEFPLLLVLLVSVLGGILIIIILIVLIVWCTKCRNKSVSNSRNTGPVNTSVTLRYKANKKAKKNARNNVNSKTDAGSNYQRTIPDETVHEVDINYDVNVSNYNRAIPNR